MNKPSEWTATVAVSGLHRGESPQPGGAVIAGLRRAWPQIRVIGMAYDPLESGIFSQGLDRIDQCYVFPYPGRGEEALLARLKEVRDRSILDAVIPCLDSELNNFIAIEPELARLGIRTLLPTAHSLAAIAKPAMPETCRALGIQSPRSGAAQDPAGLAAQALEIGYPCYVKGRLYGATLVHNVSELYAAFDKMFSLWGGPVLVQQAIVGEEFDVAGVGDGEGGLEASCTIRKLLRSSLGKAFAGIVVRNEALLSKVRALVRHTKWRGPFEAEFIVPTGGEPYLMEVNPRFPAWIGFPAAIGCNMPALHFANLMGWPKQPTVDIEPGRMFFRHSTDLIADISEIAGLLNGELGGPPGSSLVADLMSKDWP